MSESFHRDGVTVRKTWSELIQRECRSAETRRVDDERAVLRPWNPSPIAGRYTLRGVHAPYRGQENTGAPGALAMGSVIIRDELGELMVRERDYVLDETFGTVCLSEASELAEQGVSISYRYSLRRLDSIVGDAGGRLSYLPGVSHLCAPRPPILPVGATRLANVFIDYFQDSETTTVWPVGEVSPTPDSDGRISWDRERGLRVLFLGDSVTEGAEASTDQDAYATVAERVVRSRLPLAAVEFGRAAVGGSRLAEWLGPDDRWDWSVVERYRPDLVVVEFVNDAHADPQSWSTTYGELFGRLTKLGSHLLLTTPHFTMPAWMPGGGDLDRRPYVRFLREFARDHDLPLADVSRGWEALQHLGIPYPTMLANGINHPDDRGHELAGRIIGDCIAGLLSQ